MDETARHSGIARESFGISIRGQLVDFANGSRIEAVDQMMRDAIEIAGAGVDWDDDEPVNDVVGPDVPRRRGRPPKVL